MGTTLPFRSVEMSGDSLMSGCSWKAKYTGMENVADTTKLVFSEGKTKGLSSDTDSISVFQPVPPKDKEKNVF